MVTLPKLLTLLCPFLFQRGPCKEIDESWLSQPSLRKIAQLLFAFVPVLQTGVIANMFLFSVWNQLWQEHFK